MARIGLPSYLDFANWCQQGIRVAPKFTLPDGVKVAVIPKHPDLNLTDIVGRGGVQWFRANNVADSAKLRWMESKEMFPGFNPGGERPGRQKTPQQWVDVANSMPLFAAEIDEFLEGEANIDTQDSQYTSFKQARKAKYQAGGVSDPEIYLCYGALILYGARGWKVDGVYQGPLGTYYRNLYSSQSAARNTMPGYFNVHEGTSLPNVKYYPEGPATAPEFYEKLHEMEVMMKGLNIANPRCAYVSSQLIESLPDTIPDNRPGWDTHILIYQGRQVGTAGKVTAQAHPDWDWDQQLAMYLIIGLMTGKRVIAWDDTSQYGTDPVTIYQSQPGDFHITYWSSPNGTPPPYGNPGYPPLRLTWYEAIYAACHIYKQFERTAGQNWQYLKFRVGDGPWIEPQADGSDVLFAAANSRGIAKGRFYQGAYDFVYYNPSKPKDRTGYETITVEFSNGQQYTRTCQGRVVNPFAE
ncbi:hypothetical protein DYU11_20005 [Fibrisoma montanum]|uniref:Uncharacterized protein n=1 Tax=Fibrisoma montanum TaxID=2305895 RepID=A0A418M3J7_9BACT|nr:hypothetical protein [Fibrisoma montanum]RIV20338.1 hypothetical protein DYU11_20005 [Fibrisoma montanum]